MNDVSLPGGMAAGGDNKCLRYAQKEEWFPEKNKI